ncbi:MAG: EscN/YscN/HrcN family type III secretion system ATPase, partial [Pseudomonadota bacterium]
ISRVAPRLMSADQAHASQDVRALIAKHAEIEFLLQVGEYSAGSDPLADRAIERRASIDAFLRQSMTETVDAAATEAALREIVR